MSRQSEFKKKFNPEMGKYTRQHIYGEGLTDTLKTIGSKLFKNTAKKAMTTAATKTGEHVGKKAGDKIVSLLSKEKPPSKTKKTPNKTKSKNNQHEINARVNSILSGGKII